VDLVDTLNQKGHVFTKKRLQTFPILSLHKTRFNDFNFFPNVDCIYDNDW